MSQRVIATEKAPAAIGPYVQARLVDGWLYCSGQIALDPATGQIIEGDVAKQTTQVMKNIQAVLDAAGATKEHAVKTTIFLKNMGDFATVNAIYADYFGEHKPARACVEVSCLPKNVDVEIELIAYLN